MHFVNNSKNDCVEDFINKNVFELFEKSGYYKIAIDQ
jgi:hypothetical protein